MDLLAPLIPDSFYDSLPLIGLYAETHFRFRIPFSRYFRREPELIFDTPWRLQPGQMPSIFLVIHDAHLYPVHLNSVEIIIHQDKQPLGSQIWHLDQNITEQQNQLEFSLTEVQIPWGEIEIIPILNYTVNGKKRRMKVNNYPGISKTPLVINMAGEDLPKLPGWFSGDMHLHSSLTNDQVEFGASLEMTRKGAELFGMDFLTLTDHSYDLDDMPDNYLKNDPDLLKWKASRLSIKQLNSTHPLTIIPGEEISISNAQGLNVHLLHYNDTHFFPGSGDSGEDWLDLQAELSIGDVLSQRSPDTVSVAAHSVYKVPWLQRFLLRRGFWDTADHEHLELDGVQILNGTPASRGFQESRQTWIDSLLKGIHLAVYGGSDAHGNFNRNWHVKLPMWSLGAHGDQIFAQARTLLHSDSNKLENLIQAMEAGRTAVTTGPVGDLNLSTGSQEAGIGDTLKLAQGQEIKILIQGISSVEFGSEMDVILYWGDLQNARESILHHDVDLDQHFELTIPFTPSTNGYLRLEITSEGSHWPGLYLSSPIWVEITSS